MLGKLRQLFNALLICSLPLASAEEILVIVNSDIPVKALTSKQLALIYKRKIILTPQGTRWNPINLQADNTLRRVFSQQVFHQLPEDMESYWNVQYFNGITPPYVVSSQQAMLHFVLDTPGAIGYILPCYFAPPAKIVLKLSVPKAAIADSSCDGRNK